MKLTKFYALNDEFSEEKITLKLNFLQCIMCGAVFHLVNVSGHLFANHPFIVGASCTTTIILFSLPSRRSENCFFRRISAARCFLHSQNRINRTCLSSSSLSIVRAYFELFLFFFSSPKIVCFSVSVVQGRVYRSVLPNRINLINRLAR